MGAFLAARTLSTSEPNPKPLFAGARCCNEPCNDSWCATTGQCHHHTSTLRPPVSLVNSRGSRRLLKIVVDSFEKERECVEHQTTTLIMLAFSFLAFVLMTAVLIWMCHERFQPP